MTTQQDANDPLDPVYEPTNLALLRLLSSRLAAAYAVLPGKERESERWAAVAFQTASPPQVHRTS